MVVKFVESQLPVVTFKHDVFVANAFPLSEPSIVELLIVELFWISIVPFAWL